jgi:hypothetical protein
MRKWYLLLLLLLPGFAQAGDVAQAQDLSRRAAKAYKAKQYQEALDLFSRANKLVPHPNLDINIGRSHEKLGHPEQAMLHCRLALQSPDAPPRTKKAARACVERVEPQLKAPNWYISSTPPGGELRIDGALMGRTPWRGPVPAGRRQIDVVMEGFTPANRTIIAERGKPGSAALVLSPAKVGGVVSLDSLPSGASVTMDGEFVGTTPIVGFIVPAGRHDLSLSMVGYESQRLTLAVADGVPLQRTISMLTAADRLAQGRRPQWPAWTMMGAGLVAIGVGAVFGVQAIDSRGEADKLARTSTLPEDRLRYDGLVSDMEVQRTTADVLITTGSVAILGGLTWMIWPEDP